MLKRSRCAAWFGLLLLTLVMSGGVTGRAQSSASALKMPVPVFQVDPDWPRLPNNWVLGAVASVTTDKRDHVWILHRPLLVPENQRDHAAPPVLEFDGAGK